MKIAIIILSAYFTYLFILLMLVVNKYVKCYKKKQTTVATFWQITKYVSGLGGWSAQGLM